MFVILICLNKKYIFPNYNKCKLLTFTEKNRRPSEHAQCAYLKVSAIYFILFSL